ncbi:Serine/threonine-protein phosphatase 6 regulatory ankyrin repeat subunit C [Nymphon striatum]|nr:Serine/threonine-protein phosphatase 6 regulatory ankyrin repeat subunit C [Nymphon striatum]
MHGKQARKLGQSDTLDDLRFLWATTTDKPASMLPPAEGAFEQHVLRAKYQTAIWCSSHISKPELLDPVGHGWERNTDNELQPTMYTKDSAPVEMRDITHLYCTDKNCTNPRKCPCALASLGCLDICSCKGDCHNPKNKLPEEEEYAINVIKLFLPCTIPVVEIWQMQGLKFVFLLINQSNVTLRGYITLLYFKDGSTLIHIASENGHPETAMVFLRKGVPLHMPNKAGARCIHIAAQRGHVEVVRALLMKGENVDTKTNDNHTALHIAVKHCKPLVVELLLGYGAQVHIKAGETSETPLHIAARVQNGEKCAEMLLKSGTDVNSAQLNGETALHFSARYGHFENDEVVVRRWSSSNKANK